MATLTIKNVPDELYQDLKQQAKLNHRSLNSEAIVSLTMMVNRRASAQKFILDAQAIRIKENPIIELTDDMINNAKQQGRL